MTLTDGAVTGGPLTEGVKALRQLVAARRAADPDSIEAVRRWQSAPLQELRELSRHGAVFRGRAISLRQRTALCLLLADRLAVDALEESDPELLREAEVSLFIAALLVARARHLSIGQRLAAVRLAERMARSLRVPPNYRNDLRRKIAEFAKIEAKPDWEEFLARSMTGTQAMALVDDIQRGVMALAPISTPAVTNDADSVSAADLLARAANHQSAEVNAEQVAIIDYDLADSDVRLRSILLRGFRGSPGELNMDFVFHDSASSALLFGENGVGKSTIVDAIEFALQGRIGRSSYFDSPLLPAVRYIGKDEAAFAQATLSDDTLVSRSAALVDGRVEIAPHTVRPGFRLAPITIKRSDILRFLDTEALERGSALLDYFPADAEELAVRPDEEVHRLQAEMAELRIRRSTLATELSRLLSVPETELSASDKFNRAVRKHIMGNETKKAFEAHNGWDGISVELRDLIGQLASVHEQLKRLKRRTEQTTQLFNPVAHRQQASILRAILENVAADLSDAFTKLAVEHPIAKIDVVFGASGPLSLDVLVKLKGGLNCFPQQIFSEAYQDLLALLFFVSVAKEASNRGQARILIMDDVLQSIDSKVRHEFVDYLLTEFSDWQLILTTHDRLWLDQLRDLFDAHEHTCVERSIYNWNFYDGPRLTVLNADHLTRDLRAALGTAEPRTIGALAGQLLEVTCDQLTKRMHLSIARTANDQYTLGDLWPVVGRAFAEQT